MLVIAGSICAAYQRRSWLAAGGIRQEIDDSEYEYSVQYRQPEPPQQRLRILCYPWLGGSGAPLENRVS